MSDSIDRYPLRNFTGASPATIQDALERAEVVFFDRSPVELPSEEDLMFLREGLPRELRVKNISYHPESDSIPRFAAASEIKDRVERILRTHGKRVEEFLQQSIPELAPG
ncbi:MAG TPA: Kdo hydroxylase family protein, partial [Gammaproteobacteria bacterium]|nr:Kdo hydroxylase family protein [Gammaproteobacteria bacterium]